MDKRQRKRVWERIRKDRHEDWSEAQAQKRRNSRLGNLNSDGSFSGRDIGFRGMTSEGLRLRDGSWKNFD